MKRVKLFRHSSSKSKLVSIYMYSATFKPHFSTQIKVPGTNTHLESPIVAQAT